MKCPISRKLCPNVGSYNIVDSSKLDLKTPICVNMTTEDILKIANKLLRSNCRQIMTILAQAKKPAEFKNCNNILRSLLGRPATSPWKLKLLNSAHYQQIGMKFSKNGP
jgi:hypothetical protein